MENVIEVKGIYKQYRLGYVGTAALKDDLIRFGYRILGKSDPFQKVTQENVRDSGSKNPYVWALQDINFEVNQGDVLGIIGRNGAGKSTLLKLLSRITMPTRGEISINGRVGSLLEVGTGFHPELTGRENIFLNGAILGMSKSEIQRKLDEIIAFSGVERYVDTPVKRYSSGMKVRLGFAVAAHLEPEILIIDEVLAVGDQEFQNKCLGKMKEVSGEGRTVLFVSHNMASIENLCSKCLLMDNGKVLENGPTASIINKYLHMSNKYASQEISHRTDRKGVGHIRVDSVKFYGAESNLPLNEIKCGQKLSIQLNFESEIKEFKMIEVAIAIYDSNRRLITNFNNSVSQALFPVMKSSNTVVCSIPKVPLLPGRYFIDVKIESSGILQDLINDVISLDVIDGNYFGTGKMPKHSLGGVLIDHAWKLEQI